MIHLLEIWAVIRAMGGFSDHMRGKLFDFRENTSVSLGFASACLFIEMVFLLQLFFDIMASFLNELFPICKVLIDDFLAFVLGCHVFLDLIVIEILPSLDSFGLQSFVFGLTVFPIINCDFPIVYLCILYGGVMRE